MIRKLAESPLAYFVVEMLDALPDVFAVRLIDGKRPPYPYELSDHLIAPAQRWLAGATPPTILDRER